MYFEEGFDLRRVPFEIRGASAHVEIEEDIGLAPLDEEGKKEHEDEAASDGSGSSTDELSSAVEETFVNKSATATLKLNHARTVCLLAPSLAGLEVESYAPNRVKKSVVGAGHAGKEQVQMMIRILLPGAEVAGPDAADALAVAICHAHHCGPRYRLAKTGTGQ